MMCWVISGACRKAGKTRLGQELTKVLPHAVYAKIGHGVRREDKPENYFTRVQDFFAFLKGLKDCSHCVVESNRPELLDFGDIRIYLSAPSGTHDIRDDAPLLRERADVSITREADAHSRRKAVEAKLDDASLVETVCAVLETQFNHLFKKSE